jgi:anti-anti-sigma factor
VSTPLNEWLERSSGALTDHLTTRLLTPAGAGFRVWGEEATEAIAARLIAALLHDMTNGGDVEIRAVLMAMSNELSPKGLSFYDLRIVVTSLRTLVLAKLSTAPEVGVEDRSRVEAWLFQAVLVSALSFVAERERAFQDRTAALEVTQLENQLVELKLAYEEKTHLLDVIRDASTPIVPIHTGILVVPLIGVLDESRAQTLIEKLMNAIVQARAYVVILDMSGVPFFNTATAEHVLEAARISRLIGAELVLVGLSPQVARTVVSLAVDFTGIATRRSLQDGLAYALEQRRLRITALPAR